MDFALSQFDLMNKVGMELENIRETDKWKVRHADVISSIKRFEEQREEYYQNEMMTNPDDEEHEWIVNWINEDFLSFLKEQLYCYHEGGAGQLFVERSVEEHTYIDDVQIGVWKTGDS